MQHKRKVSFDFLAGFQDLPPLARELIASKLGRHRAAILRLVSKDWKDAVSATLEVCIPSKGITDQQLDALCSIFPNVSYLDLRRCRKLTNAALPHLERLSGLSSLNLGLLGNRLWKGAVDERRYFKFFYLSSICLLTKLKELDLSGCKYAYLETLLGITGLTSLSALSLEEMDVSETNLQSFAQLASLEQLSLVSCMPFGGEDLSESLILMVTSLPKLKKLDLSSNFFGDTALRKLEEWAGGGVGVEFNLEYSRCSWTVSMPTLLNLLRRSCPWKFKVLALESLSADDCPLFSEWEVLEADGVRAVVELVPFTSEFDEVQIAALEALQRMVDCSEGVLDALLEAGFVSRLYTALTSNGGLEECGHFGATQLLVSMCGHNNVLGLNAVRESGAMALLIDYIASTPDDSLSQTLAICFAQIRKNSPILQEDIDSIIRRILVHPFFHEQTDFSADTGRFGVRYYARNAVNVLVYLVSGNSSSCEALVRAGGIKSVLLLLAKPKINAHSVISAVSELIEALISEDFESDLCEAGAISALKAVLKSGIFDEHMYSSNELKGLAAPSYFKTKIKEAVLNLSTIAAIHKLSK